MDENAETNHQKAATNDSFPISWLIAMVSCTMLLAVVLALIKPWA